MSEGEGTGGTNNDEMKAQLESLQSQLNDQNAEVERLRTHSAKLLDEKKKLQQQYEGFADLGDAETLKNMLNQFKNDEEARMFAEGKGAEVLKKHTERMQMDFTSQLDEIKKELATSKDEGSKYRDLYHQSEAGHALRAAAVAAGVRESAVDDILLRGRGVFTVGDNNQLEARDSEGNLRKVGNKALSPDLFIKGLRDTHPHYWPDSQSGGARGGTGGGNSVPNPFVKGSDTYNVTQQAKLRREDPELAKQLEAEAKAAAQG